jgi:hypothetical protein
MLSSSSCAGVDPVLCEIAGRRASAEIAGRRASAEIAPLKIYLVRD